MLPTKELEDYIDNARLSIKFFLKCHQWDGLLQQEVDDWLENFAGTPEGQYYSIRLLDQLLYYSEQDMENLLSEGIFHKVLGKKILLTHQLANDFKTSQPELQFEFEECLKKTLFVPLLDVKAPYESGNQISRILTNRLNVDPSNVLYAQDITDVHASFDNLIIVDDCIGSGEQCCTFWSTATVSDGSFLRTWCLDNQVEPTYVALIGYFNSIQNLTSVLPDLNIHCIETIGDEYRVFGENNIYWSNNTERDDALEYFREITEQFGIPLFGYNDLDLAIIMHKNIPDWSLPLFWKKRADWSILMRRKNSDD